MAHDKLNITRCIFIIDLWTDLACWQILVYILTSNNTSCVWWNETYPLKIKAETDRTPAPYVVTLFL